MQVCRKDCKHNRKPGLRTQRRAVTLDTVSRIHVFKVFDMTLLFDTATGSLLLPDEESAEMFSKLESGQKPNLPKEIQTLVDDGVIMGKIAIPKPQTLSPKSLCLIVSHACNLNCTYCSLGSVTGEGTTMSIETARKTLDWLVPNAPGQKIDIDFFGGEPLLAWETVKDSILYGNELAKKFDKNLRWSMSTNAVGLTDEILDFCDEKYVSLVLSLDGAKQANDVFRLTKLGQSSYDKVLSNILKVVARRERGYYVRGTYTAKTINFADEVITLHKLGIKSLAFEPVVTSDADLALTEEMLPVIRQEYEKLAKYYVEQKISGNPFRYYHFELNLEQGPCIRKSAGGCGAGAEYLAVSPNGTFYVCHQLDGMKDFSLGNLNNPPSQSDFDVWTKNNHLLSKPECLNCWAMFLCSGGCLAANKTTKGDIRSLHDIGCEIQKIRLEIALWINSYLRICGTNSSSSVSDFSNS